MYEDVCYQKTFLKEVIARIDFFTPAESFEKSLSPKLVETLTSHFPINEPQDSVMHELTLDGQKVHQREIRSKQWNFFGKEREKQLAISPQFMFVTYSKYGTYENFKLEFTAVVDAVLKSNASLKARRMGLRFVNVIEPSDLASPYSWDSYIAAPLLPSLAFFSESNRLTRLIQIAELRYEDLQVRFQFGMPNPDYPATMKRAQFVLDLDAYVDTAQDLTYSGLFIDEAHSKIQDLFERSITAGLRERMHATKSASIQK
jgi:uncharacterized protein (TIGR04255 family)